MFNFIKDKLGIKIEPKYFKQAIMLVLILGFYAVILLMNFSEMKLDTSKLYDSTFWTKYCLALGFSISVMAMAIIMRKDGNRRKNIIVDSLEYISALRSSIIENGLYDDFKNNYLSKRNKEMKLDKYRDMLLNKRDKAVAKKNKVLEDKYNALYQETLNEGFNIEARNIKIKELAVSIIFHGYKNKENGKGVKVDYTGFEGGFHKIVPSILFGVSLTVLSLIFYISPAESTADKWKEILIIVMMSLSYILTGISFADHSVLSVYYMVLQSRIDIIKSFLFENGKGALIEENPAYKYKITLEPTKEQKDELQDK